MKEKRRGSALAKCGIIFVAVGCKSTKAASGYGRMMPSWVTPTSSCLLCPSKKFRFSRLARMDSRLARMVSACKDGSPKLEGFVCHMVYPRGHAKNQLQKWGQRAHKNFQYYADNNMKVKREGAIKMTVTGMFRTTQYVGSEMPHEDRPAKVTYCATVKYTLPDGSIKTKDTIPLENVLAGKILQGLEHKHEFDAWGRYIDWYCNSDRTDKNVNPIRFLVLNTSLYSAFDKSHVRDQHADGSVKDKFACETPATRKFSAKSAQEQRKINDARENKLPRGKNGCKTAINIIHARAKNSRKRKCSAGESQMK